MCALETACCSSSCSLARASFDSGATTQMNKTNENRKTQDSIHLAFLHAFVFFEVVPKALRNYIFHQHFAT